MEHSDPTEYYEKNASAFIDATLGADVSELYEPFERFLAPGCRILDLGCGSGRDSRYFSEKGYDIVAIDPSKAMCEQTRAVANVPVFQMKAEEMDFLDEFDGVWACASLLHVPREQQEHTLRLIGKTLKTGGVCYCSWKYGEQDRVAGGRPFTDLTEASFRTILEKIPEIEEIDVWITQDVRSDRQEQKWLNGLVRKV